MRKAAQGADMKVLIIGVAIAAAAGAVAGGALRPVLAQAPPPMEAAAASPADYADAAGAWSGNGPVPDYVVGTDYLPQTASPIPLADVVWPEMEPPQPSPPPPPPSSATAYKAEPAPPSAYPSEQGDILAGVHRTTSSDDPAPEPPSA